MADDERYTSVAGRWPAAIPRVPTEVERLLALDPDLVMVADFTPIETRELLQSSRVSTLLLSSFTGFESYRSHIRTIAAAVGARHQGEALVQRFDESLQRLRGQKFSSRPTILSWSSGVVAGAGTTFDDQARAAGYEHLAASHGLRGHAQVSLEQVMVWNPDYLVVSCGSRPCDEVERELATAAGFAATTAGRSNGIIAIPSRQLYSTGADMLLVVEHLIARHPGRLPDGRMSVRGQP
jgi:iron complex transport system substrate-binding protein